MSYNRSAKSRMSASMGGAGLNLGSDLSGFSASALASRKENIAMKAQELNLAALKRNEEREMAVHNQQMFINNNHDAIANDLSNIDPEAEDYDDRIAHLPSGIDESPLFKGKIASLTKGRQSYMARVSAQQTARKGRQTDFLNKGGGQFLTARQRDEANLLFAQGSSVADVYGRFGNAITLGESNAAVQSAYDETDTVTKASVAQAKGNLDYATSLNKGYKDEIDKLEKLKMTDALAKMRHDDSQKEKLSPTAYISEWDYKDGNLETRLKAAREGYKNTIGNVTDRRKAFNDVNKVRGQHIANGLKVKREAQLPKLGGLLINSSRRLHGALEELGEGARSEDKDKLIRSAAIENEGLFKTAVALQGDPPAQEDKLRGAKQLSLTLKAREFFTRSPQSRIYYNNENDEFVFNPLIEIGADERQRLVRHESFKAKYRKLDNGQLSQERSVLQKQLSDRKLNPDEGLINAIALGYAGEPLSVDDADNSVYKKAHKAVKDKFNAYKQEETVSLDEQVGVYQKALEGMTVIQNDHHTPEMRKKIYSDPEVVKGWVKEWSAFEPTEADLKGKTDEEKKTLKNNASIKRNKEIKKTVTSMFGENDLSKNSEDMTAILQDLIIVALPQAKGSIDQQLLDIFGESY